MDAIHDNFENLMVEAERLANQIGERFTPIRRHVYKSLIGAPQPLGAYEILDMLDGIGAQKPPTVYRALDWLLKLGLIRKVSSISKFVALPQGQSTDPMAVLICRDCGKVDVMESNHPVTQLIDAAKGKGFKEVEATLEILGECDLH